MTKPLHYIRKYLSCCLNCGSLWIIEFGLCRPCYIRFRSHEDIQANLMDGAVVYSLFEWKPGQSDLLSSYFVSLKGGGRQEHWKKMAHKFVANRLSSLPPRVVVVPAPPSKPGQKDHAYEWGKALADILGADFAPCLRKVRSTSQRWASREEREDLRMETLENYTGLRGVKDTTLWIFADDILTTGATARAARKGLGSPPHFETWVLGRRKLSCGASRHLL